MEDVRTPTTWIGFWNSIRDAVRGSYHDFTVVSLDRAILLLAIPMMLEMALESLFGVVDILWVARVGSNAVAAVGVVGVPEARLGETLAAFIVPMDSAHPPRSEELSSFARVKLAGFKIPQYWYTVAELPLNSAGKVVRAQLRDAHLKRQHSE